MVTHHDTKTPTILIAILVSSLVACKLLKKDKEELPEVPSASAAPATSQPVAEAPQPPEEKKQPELKLGDVKRFKDKEKEAEGVVKVLEADLKVFNEPDTKTPHVAELNKDIFVGRLATLDDFVLVEFPSGVGELSPGWVEAKFLSDPDSKVSADNVKKQTAAATLVTPKDEPAKTEEKKDEPAKTEEKKDEPAKTEEKKDEPAKTTPEREKPRRKF